LVETELTIGILFYKGRLKGVSEIGIVVLLLIVDDCIFQEN